MMKVYERIENGSTTYVSISEAMAEVNDAMMGPRKNIREMSSGRTAHHIRYADGRKVRMTLVDAPSPEETPETDSEGRRIVTVKGKKYVVSAVTPARPKTPGAVSWIPEAYVSYWSGGLLGIASGPTRSASASSKPGTVGRAIWDAVNR